MAVLIGKAPLKKKLCSLVLRAPKQSRVIKESDEPKARRTVIQSLFSCSYLIGGS
jgi:hypothetical protein